MVLPKNIRIEIAENIVRIVAPVLLISMAVLMLGIFVVGDQQYHRLIPTTIVIMLVIPGWLLSFKQCPLLGAILILAAITIAIASGMIVSGGVRAPAYMAMLSCITIVVVLYGLRGGLIGGVITLAVGGLFIWFDNIGYLPKVSEPPLLLYFLIFASFLIMQIYFVWIPVRLMLNSLVDSQHHGQELQHAVNERKKTEQQYQSILDKTPDIIYRLDVNGKITFISEAIRKYGYDPAKLTGKSILDLIHPGDRDAVSRGLIERRRGKRSTHEREARIMKHSETSGKKADDTSGAAWATFLVSSNGIYAHDQINRHNYIGTQGIARDVSRLKSMAKQITQLAACVEQAAEDIVITDTEGIIRYVNPKFEELTGYTKEEAIGQTPKILYSGKHDRLFYADMWKTIRGGKTWNGHIWNKIKNGSFILQDVTITPIFDESRNLTGYTSVRRDITKQTLVEERLRQSQKMEAIGQLSGGIAHDFNNILSGILGYAELALEDVKDNPAIKRKLDRVIEAGYRAIELVKQILSFSRSQKKELRPTDPQAIAKEVLKLIRASLPSTIEIKKSLLAKNLIMADATNFHQILMNLCTNAGHALRDSGGVLSVILEDIELTQKDVIHYVGLNPGKYLKITVEDTGHGIPAEIQKKVFDPFFTTKKMDEGTGLGLSAVHGMVKDMDGVINLCSEVGKGTAFYILIPAIEDLSTAISEVSRVPLVGGTERILIVDDEEIQVEMMQESLQRMGYRINMFSNSISALEQFQQNPEDYDLVITDMTMPQMTGDVLADKIKTIRPDIPVMMCTGFSEKIDEKKAKAIGIAALLHKPVVKKELLQTIRKILDRKTV